jgi:hypothetical protein
MSTAKKNRHKAMKRAADAADPERQQVRNLIRRGKIPRWSYLGRDHDVAKKGWGRRGLRRNGIMRIAGAFGVIFDTKKSVVQKGKNQL